MKCVECRGRKGKRACPALGGDICPQCCGEKRVIKIPCPPDCPYLQSGQAYHWTKNYIGMLEAEENPRRREDYYRTLQSLGPLIHEIEEVIVRYSSPIQTIRDRDILEALEKARETSRTESKGLIYEHSSANPIAQSLVRELGQSLEKRREEIAKKGGPRIKAEDLVACYELLEAFIRYHLANSDHPKSYLHFVTRNHPEAAREEGGGGEGIIISS